MVKLFDFEASTNKKNKDFGNIELNTSNCAKCGATGLPIGRFIDVSFPLAFPFKFGFLSMQIKLKMRLKYCPSCGFLKVEINQ